ncbi:MAG: TetR/AcrR family transcriptional regulator [Chloroflexota bacterium]
MNTEKKRGRPSLETQFDVDEILDSAIQVFAKKGYDGASLNDVARQAGVKNLSVLNYHFGNKEDIWKQAITRLGKKLTDRLEQTSSVLQDVTGVQLMKAYMRQFIYFSAEHPDFHRMVALEMCARSDRTEWLVHTLLDPFHQVYEPMFNSPEFQESHLGQIPPANLSSFVIGAATTFFFQASQMEVQYGIDPFSPEEIEKHVDAVYQLFFPDLSG